MGDMKTPENGSVGNSFPHEGGEQTPPKGFSIRVESPDLILNAVQKGASGELGRSLLAKPIEYIGVNLSSEREHFNLEATVGLDVLFCWDNNNWRTGRFRESVAEQFGELKERGGNFIITGSR